MKSLLEALKLSAQFLKNHGIEASQREAEFLFADFFGISRMELYLQFDRPLEEKELSGLRERLSRRAKHEPLAYIHGEVQFYGLSLFVNNAVLIPRQETEVLVDLIVKDLKKQDLTGKKLLDLCTGSGCIGLSLKKSFPQLDIVLSDLSQRALAIAAANATKNGLAVEIVQGDLLTPFQNQEFDFVVSNPPYISEAELDSLDRDVKDFEPKEALIAGKTGLEFFERIRNDLPRVLKKKGRIWLEIGFSQAPALKEIFKPLEIEVLSDYSGHDRFIRISDFG